MKRYSTHVVCLISILFILRSESFAQPDYSFKNPVLISGTDLQTGAVYKFSNVKTGVDANITIMGSFGGITLTAIDESWTGFDEAFQPFIKVATNSNGYVEFKIDFVSSSTEVPMAQSMVPITCIDVDGEGFWDGTIFEQDQVEYLNGFYDFNMTGSNLQVTNPPGWLNIKNTSGFSYNGIDTSQKDVMATVVNLNVSSIKVRIGALNTSGEGTQIRFRSVYFKRFTYSNSILLPNRTTVRLSGNAKNNGVEIKGALSASHTFDRMIIERSTDGVSMLPIAEIPVANTNSSEYPFTYFDNTTTGPVYYYRLRLVNTVQRIYEISNTIMVKLNTAGDGKELKLVNTMMNSNNPVLTIKSNSDEEASMQITDLSGRVILKNNARIYSGMNSIPLSNFNAAHGYFIITVATKQNTISQKIIIR
jgi:hypothetical protein